MVIACRFFLSALLPCPSLLLVRAGLDGISVTKSQIRNGMKTDYLSILCLFPTPHRPPPFLSCLQMNPSTGMLSGPTVPKVPIVPDPSCRADSSISTPLHNFQKLPMLIEAILGHPNTLETVATRSDSG